LATTTFSQRITSLKLAHQAGLSSIYYLVYTPPQSSSMSVNWHFCSRHTARRSAVSYVTDLRHFLSHGVPSLLYLLAATLALIALTEYAIRRLPAHNASGIVTPIHDKASAEVSLIIKVRNTKSNP